MECWLTPAPADSSTSLRAAELIRYAARIYWGNLDKRKNQLDSEIRFTKKSHWSTIIRSFIFLFISSSISAFILYFGTSLLGEKLIGEAPIYVTDGYHGGTLWTISEHPFPFLLSITFILSTLGVFWITVIKPKVKRFQILQILSIPWITLVFVSPIWGLIWSFYRWPPEGFSDPALMWRFYRHDAIFGLRFGWLSAFMSFPINLLSYVVVVGLILLFNMIESRIRMNTKV